MSRLRLSNGVEFGANLGLGEHSEAEVLVERSVPRNLGEAGEGHRRSTGLDCPRSHAVKQGATNAQALMIGPDAHLFDVSVAVDFVNKDVAHRLIPGVDGDPTASLCRV